MNRSPKRNWLAPLVMYSFTCIAGYGQDLLPGEFGDISLGRELVEPTRIPTVKQLRAAVARESVEPVLLLKMHGGQDNATVPVWSHDGLRLAFLRSNVAANSSKLLVYNPLSLATPLQFTDGPRLYDYMFRWGVNGDGCFVFTRIDAGGQNTQLYFSADGENIETKSARPGAYAFPALYERTDGIWRMVYDFAGNLMHQAWDANGEVEAPLKMMRGSSPRWSSDGRRLLILQERTVPGRLAAMDLVVRDLRKGSETLLQTPRAGTIRGPVWSPDETRVAFFVRDVGENKPWRIDTCVVDAAAQATTVGEDVIVNLDFTSEGPAWSPDGQRLWFFSQSERTRAFYPLVSVNIDTGQKRRVDYSNRLTTPADVAVNPQTKTPEIAFIANDGGSRDLFVVFLNR